MLVNDYHNTVNVIVTSSCGAFRALISFLGSIGTVGRQLGKKLRLYAKSSNNREVSFNVTDSGRPNGDQNRRGNRPASAVSNYTVTM